MSSVSSHQVAAAQPRWRAPLDVVQVVLLEVLQRGGDRGGRAVTETAERAAEDVVAGVQQRVQVLMGALAGQDPPVGPDHPVVALPARGAFAARLVLVEL